MSGSAAVAAVATLASAGIGAYGAISSGVAQEQSARYNAEVALNNASIAKQNANLAGQAGEAQAEQSSMKTRAQVGAIKTAQAANGVDVNSGSAVDVRSSAAALGELNAINIRSNAARTAYGYQTQAGNFQAQSQLDTFQGQNAKTAGLIGGGTDLLGGVGQAAGYFSGIGNAGSSSGSSSGGGQ